ncbi:hypothetical protein [Saccharopolyspora oryzae]|uniref:Uncharacterized protein n=1 Tax=Saccharopolyspora oryzae TaxID=2997343 RepID=A0ABT4UZH7_9PSEU|nr:hypothetical protein [Saccharopolyspora oryzae]MDA3626529.1 hypothetical protein [Saccharopolyspora oryzae]
MIAALIATAVLGVGGVALWATFYFAPARHAGGEGALTVAYLVARVEAETRGQGRHRLRDPVVLHDNLADEATQRIPVVEPESPEDDRELESMQRHPVMLRRLLDALRDLPV